MSCARSRIVSYWQPLPQPTTEMTSSTELTALEMVPESHSTESLLLTPQNCPVSLACLVADTRAPRRDALQPAVWTVHGDTKKLSTLPQFNMCSTDVLKSSSLDAVGKGCQRRMCQMGIGNYGRFWLGRSVQQTLSHQLKLLDRATDASFVSAPRSTHELLLFIAQHHLWPSQQV